MAAGCGGFGVLQESDDLHPVSGCRGGDWPIKGTHSEHGVTTQKWGRVIYPKTQSTNMGKLPRKAEFGSTKTREMNKTQANRHWGIWAGTHKIGYPFFPIVRNFATGWVQSSQGEFKVQSEQIEKPPGRSVDLAEAFEYFSGDYSQLGAVTWKHFCSTGSTDAWMCISGIVSG